MNNSCILRSNSNQSERNTTLCLTASRNISRLLFASLQVLRFRQRSLSSKVDNYRLHRINSYVKFVIFSTSGNFICVCNFRRRYSTRRCLFTFFRRRKVIKNRVEFAFCNVSSSSFYLTSKEQRRFRLYQRNNSPRACSANYYGLISSLFK